MKNLTNRRKLFVKRKNFLGAVKEKNLAYHRGKILPNVNFMKKKKE